MKTPLAVLDSPSGYRRHFMDVGLWEPYVRLALQRHALPCPEIRAGLPGSFPTFLCGGHVVKFFGRPLDGKQAFEVERACAHLLSLDPPFPASALLGEGRLAGWDYLIFETVMGVSFGQDRERIGPRGRLAVARWLGRTVRHLHALSPDDPALSSSGRGSYSAFLSRQFRRLEKKKAGLPPRLRGQLEGYLLRPEAMIPPGSVPHLIHADLTGDHLLGCFAGDEWQPLALIDFGDARIADLYYELAALHTDLFRCDREMLRGFLDSYGFEPPADFPRRAMNATLLHQFDLLRPVFDRDPPLRGAGSLEELGERLWGPG